MLDKADGALTTYGVKVHPHLLPSSNGNELLMSLGPAAIVTMYKLTFEYC